MGLYIPSPQTPSCHSAYQLSTRTTLPLTLTAVKCHQMKVKMIYVSNNTYTLNVPKFREIPYIANTLVSAKAQYKLIITILVCVTAAWQPIYNSTTHTCHWH
jgi:hypothetical protein